MNTASPTAALTINLLKGDLAPVHDPSLYQQDGTSYLFTTDPTPAIAGHFLAIRCSADKIVWKLCGQVFSAIPPWVLTAIPGLTNLWAPDISFFGGLYHLYYSGSRLGSQTSVIGLATNTTLDPADPTYHWLDRGQVIASGTGDDFNAIDPNILVDAGGRVWLTYGSFWSGIKQREIAPSTGLFLSSNPIRFALAARPEISDDAVEGASLLRHGTFYYLFLSIDHCCNSVTARDDYKQIVGRSTSPNGPFTDASGTPLTEGGGNLLLAGNSDWFAPGGGSAYLDPDTGQTILVFHAIDMHDPYVSPALWLKTLTWSNDWPTLN